MVAGTITNVNYSLLSKSLLTVHNKPRSSRSNLMQSMLQMGCDTAKVCTASSVFASKAIIHIVQKYMATNLLLGNLQIAKVGDLWGDASLFDSTAYLPQLDMAKVLRI